MRRTIRYWDPWKDLDLLQREMNRLLSPARWSEPRGNVYPPVNVAETADGLVLTAEVPGLDLETLDIGVMGDSVTIQGRRPEEKLAEGESYQRRERLTEAFSRTITLPFEVDAEAAEATYEKGILTLDLQRPEEQKPKKITVKAG